LVYREQAHPQFLNIVKANRSGLFMATLPYKLGIFSAVAAGFVSLPMIFEINTVLWFNELYVTTGKIVINSIFNPMIVLILFVSL